MYNQKKGTDNDIQSPSSCANSYIAEQKEPVITKKNYSKILRSGFMVSNTESICKLDTILEQIKENNFTSHENSSQLQQTASLEMTNKSSDSKKQSRESSQETKFLDSFERDKFKRTKSQFFDQIYGINSVDNGLEDENSQSVQLDLKKKFNKNQRINS